MSTATLTKDSLIDQTRQLCESILEMPSYQERAKQVENFLSDDAAREAYVQVNEQGRELQQKHQQGIEISEQEGNDFQALQEKMLQNPVVADFMAAQDELNTIHSTISTHVAKTLELGRLPTEEELTSGGCCGGSGESSCGC